MIKKISTMEKEEIQKIKAIFFYYTIMLYILLVSSIFLHISFIMAYIIFLHNRKKLLVNKMKFVLKFINKKKQIYINKNKLQEQISYLGVVWRDIGGRKESPSISNFSMPPMLICTICDSNYISSSELQLARLLRCKIVECLHQTLKAMTNQFQIKLCNQNTHMQI